MPTTRPAARLLPALAATAALLGATGCGGGDDSPPKPFATIYVMDGNADAVKGWDSARTVTGDVAPARSVGGASPGILGAHALAYDSRTDTILVGDNGANAIRIFDHVKTTNGDVAPSRVIAGAATLLNGGYSLAVDQGRNLIYAATDSGILVFGSAGTATGDVAPARFITGANVPIASVDHRLALDAAHDRLYVADYDSSTLQVYDAVSTKDGDAAPERVVTLPDQPWGIAIDVPRDVVYVNLYGQATILSYDHASTIDGAVSPDRAITGASVAIPEGCGMAVDTVTDMLYVTTGDDLRVWHSASTRTGDTAPDRVIAGASTTFARPVDVVGVR